MRRGEVTSEILLRHTYTEEGFLDSNFVHDCSLNDPLESAIRAGSMEHRLDEQPLD